MGLAESLAAGIENWLAEKPHRSMTMLARMSDVSYSSVRRLVQREGEPSHEVIMALAPIVFKKPELQEFVEQHYPQLKRFFEAASENSGKADDILRSKDHFRLMVLASHESGLTLEEAIRFFGEGVTPAFEDLIESGILKPSSHRYKAYIADDYVGALSFKLARKILGDMSDVYDGKIKAPTTAWVGWESLNVDALDRCNSILAKASDEILSIIQDEKSKGSILVFMGTLLNVLKK